MVGGKQRLYGLLNKFQTEAYGGMDYANKIGGIESKSSFWRDLTVTSTELDRRQMAISSLNSQVDMLSGKFAGTFDVLMDELSGYGVDIISLKSHLDTKHNGYMADYGYTEEGVMTSIGYAVSYLESIISGL